MWLSPEPPILEGLGVEEEGKYAWRDITILFLLKTNIRGEAWVWVLWVLINVFLLPRLSESRGHPVFPVFLCGRRRHSLPVLPLLSASNVRPSHRLITMDDLLDIAWCVVKSHDYHYRCAWTGQCDGHRWFDTTNTMAGVLHRNC